MIAGEIRKGNGQVQFSLAVLESTQLRLGKDVTDQGTSDSLPATPEGSFGPPNSSVSTTGTIRTPLPPLEGQSLTSYPTIPWQWRRAGPVRIRISSAVL
jgi:hypothetical protein